MAMPCKKIGLPVCATKMSDEREKKYQEKIINNIVQFINAFFHGFGGTLIVLFETKLYSKGHIKASMREIEQKVCECTGVVTFVYDVRFERKEQSLEIIVGESNTDTIYTICYNLYLPTNQQVVEVSPKEPITKVRDILCMNSPCPEAVEPDSHYKQFTLGEEVSFGESKTVQFKQLSAQRTKNKHLADRLISNNCRFLCYVSAFANYCGGYIYVGIDDNGIVKGERITPKDQAELRKKIQKAIDNMIWPDSSNGQEGEEKRWQIYFEKVKDANGDAVQSTFVIVIYVAHCPGGVFTKQPEAYEMKENEPKMMDFPTWKKNIIEGLQRSKGHCGNDGSEVSYEAKVDEMLTDLLNDDCPWSELKKASEEAQTDHHEADIRLICLSKLIKFCLRKGDYEKADEMFEEYKTILPDSSKLDVFEIMEQYLRCLKERSKGNFDNSFEIAKKCLKKLDDMQPGIVSAAFFVLIAIVFNIIATKRNQRERCPFITKAKEYYHKAELHLKKIHGFEAAKADLKQKILMNEAMLFSGSSLEGKMFPDPDVSVLSKADAQTCFDKSQHIVNHEYFPLSDLREIQRSLAQADFYFQFNDSGKPQQVCMKNALKFAKRAEKSANDAGLPEMERYANNRVTLIQKAIDSCTA